MSKQIDHQTFIFRLGKSNPNIEILEEYAGLRIPISCKCKVCGHEWNGKPENLLRTKGCPVCAKVKRRKTTEEFKHEIAVKHPNIEILGEYVHRTERVPCRCKVCGHEWRPVAKNLLEGTGCPVCARKRQRKTPEEFKHEIAVINPNIEILGEYEGTQMPVLCRCNVCGHEWEPAANSLLKGHGCPVCARKKKTTEEFKHEMAVINPNIEILGEYVHKAERVRCRCKVCGHEWNGKPENLLRTKGCPICGNPGTSFMEQFLYWSFVEILGKDKVVFHDHQVIGKELDIYLPTLNIAVEIGSWFWHKDKIDYDKQKCNEAIEAGLILWTIYDCVPKNIKMDWGAICFFKNLGREKNYITLKNLVFNILNMVPGNLILDWNKIVFLSNKYSSKISTEIFSNNVKQNNNKIEILGEYKGTQMPVLCRCNVCGHEWRPVAKNLLEGTGCPVCARKRQRKTPEEFKHEIAVKHPNIEILGEYVHRAERVRCRCKVCGHEWKPIAYSLLAGSGCPVCARKKNISQFNKVLCVETKAHI